MTDSLRHPLDEETLGLCGVRDQLGARLSSSGLSDVLLKHAPNDFNVNLS